MKTSPHLENQIKTDIIELLSNQFKKTGKNKIIFKKGKFLSLFLETYPLKYQRNDKFIINTMVLLQIIRKMDICSKHKLMRKNFNNFKFIKSKLEKYER